MINSSFKSVNVSGAPTNLKVLNKAVQNENMTNSSVAKESFQPHSKNQKSQKDRLLLALVGLGVLGIAGITYVKKPKSIISQSGYDVKKIKNFVNSERTFREYIQDYSKLYCQDFVKFKRHMKKDDKTLDFLDTIFSLHNTNNGGIAKRPDVITITNISKDNYPNVSKILSLKYGSDLKIMQYQQGQPRAFVDKLKELLDKCKQTKQHTMVQFENTKMLFEDIAKPENIGIKTDFENIFKLASDYNSTLLMHRNIKAKDLNIKAVDVTFENSIEKIDFAKKIKIHELFAKAIKDY